MTQPLVSVIMPAYNAARFIGAAIESVLAQTYPHWELIIVDDASTDNTESVVARYDDPRIRYSRIERIGYPSGVRNVGLRRANGEFITFLDADDLYFPFTLQKMVDALLHDPACIAAYGFASNMDEAGNPLPSSVSLIPAPGGNPGDPPRYLPDPTYNHSWKNIVTSQISCLLSALVLRKSTLDAVGLLNEKLYSAEDYEFYVRLFLHDYDHVQCLPDYLYRYRIYGSSLTKTPAHCHKVLDSCLTIMDWLFDEAALPAEVQGYRSPAYGATYRYLARERLLNGQPELTRHILQKAFHDQSLYFLDFIQLCLPLWLRSWLPTRFDHVLVELRRRCRHAFLRQGVPIG